MKVLVKICGLTRREDAEAAIAAGADLVGFIFVPGTPRALDLARAGWIRDLAGAERVGVFRGAVIDEIERARDLLGLDRIQLHGDEPDAWLDRLGPRTLRRVPVSAEGVDWARVATLARVCLPLIDPGAGSGVAGEWNTWGAPPAGVEFGVAGGLTPTTVGAVIRRLRPAMVDVASGVEASPGIKDPAKVAAFIAAARGA
jgi:phosphoribosylanthranilate isomerase